MPKQKIHPDDDGRGKKLTKKEIAEERREKDIWWQDSKRNGRKAIVATIIFVLFMVAIGSTAFIFDKKNKSGEQEILKLQKELDELKKNAQSEMDFLQEKLDAAQKKLDDAEKEKEKEASQKATIEGSLSYPGSYIPTDMEICAQDLENKDNLVCTKEQIMDKKYTYGVGYKLEVAPGKYNVYATVPSWQGYKAYYNDFVTCGMKYGCNSRTTIEVKAESGKTVSDIDPIDWYKQN